MGNFSRDPIARLADSVAKHYVGVRLQQGVPIVDADWNVLEDLRRLEFEDLGKWMIGNGVPAGNDGFRIMPIAGGGVNTVVLVSKSTGIGLSSVKIDLTNSTAAAVLGFDGKNFISARFGSSPAQLTGNKTQPFNIAANSTLTIQADDQPPETISFTAAQFANITAATAAEVANVITNAMSRISASAGKGNDFIMKGGDDTTANAGRILVDGQMAFNESDLKYTEQPLYENDEQSTIWSVTKVARLETPTATEPYVVYLDVWHREVDSNEDPQLVDNRIGVETAIRIRREWAVRVAKLVDFPGVLGAKPPGHSYCKLAQLNRIAGNTTIVDMMIVDERDTDASLQREIAYRGINGAVLVDSEYFMNMLIETRDNIRDFIQFLTTKFLQPGSFYFAGEVIGVDTLSTIAGIADHGIALLNAKSLGTKGAFAFFEQLLDAEKRFVNVWKSAVLPLVKPGGKIYETAYKETVEKIESFLTGPAPIGYISLTDAIQRQNLFESVRTQKQINSELGEEVDKPTGFLLLTYLGSPTPTILKNQNLDLRYKISGSVTPEDNIDVEVFVNAAWQITLKNSDGSIPFNLQLGPGNDSQEFIVTVLSPNVNNAQTPINLQVSAKHNSGLSHISAQKSLQIGAAPPPSEQDFAITIATTNVSPVGGVFQVPVSLASADMNFRIHNNTNSSITVNLEFQPTSDPLWTIVRGPFSLAGQSIPALGKGDFLFQFAPPSTAGQSLSFTFRARNASTNTVLAEIQITLITISG